MEPTTKKCNKCLVAKDRSCFTPTKQKKDGLLSTCKACINAKYWADPEKARDRANAYRNKNKDLLNESNRLRRKNDPEYRALRAGYDAKWREANLEAKAKADAAWREQNKSSICQRKKDNYWADVTTSRAVSKERVKKMVETLAPGYLNNVVASRLGVIPSDLRFVPEGIINNYKSAIKAEIQLKRLIKSKTQTNQSHEPVQ